MGAGSKLTSTKFKDVTGRAEVPYWLQDLEWELKCPPRKAYWKTQWENVCSSKIQKLSLVWLSAARCKQERLGWDSSEPPKTHDTPRSSRSEAEGSSPAFPRSATWPDASRPAPCRVFPAAQACSLTNPDPRRTSWSPPLLRASREARTLPPSALQLLEPHLTVPPPPRRGVARHVRAPGFARSLPSGASASSPLPFAALPTARGSSPPLSLPCPFGPAGCGARARTPSVRPGPRRVPAPDLWQRPGRMWRPKLSRSDERMWWSTLMSILRASAQKCVLDK
ncbi:wiskott-Aldrich syndrome protein homolog 1-like [Sturnira hondurensis]|uniref:wiskott-Aldrich syndrome protein homolog 1-like n=1 Tax=Sturnira hondurensis TaxID=192404 RepID=UPI00187AAB05|nr:wiskott-Aldrich syndrome protein homolog 1-like [Sturnira hondurensis]